jgi:hypothetical protein
VRDVTLIAVDASPSVSEHFSEIKASYFLTRFSVPLIPDTQQDLHAVEAAINLRVTNDTSVTNQIKEMARRSELYLLRRADGIYSPI